MLKEPKIYSNNNPGSAYSNMVNRAEILNEKAVYERLGTHHGIIHCFKALNESIELAFANQGDLSTYIRVNPLPSQKFRVKWIQVVVDAFSHAHARRVVIQDISLWNILVHENSLKLSDFGESSLPPLDTDMLYMNYGCISSMKVHFIWNLCGRGALYTNAMYKSL